MTRYYRLITEVDAAVGRILDEVAAQGAYDDTLVIVIGDNGYFQADRGLADKWYPYEESQRVPLVVRDPRLEAARRGLEDDHLALNLDRGADNRRGQPVCLCRRPCRAGTWVRSTWGVALRPGATSSFRTPDRHQQVRIPSSQGVIRRDWKYIEWPEFDYVQLST